MDMGPFKVNQTGELDRDELHSIDDEVQTGVSETSPICMLTKVEWRNGTALPSFLFALDLISTLCENETGTKPERVNPLNEFEALLEFAFGTVVTGIAVAVCSVGIWYEQDIEINCMMMHQSKVSFLISLSSYKKTQ